MEHRIFCPLCLKRVDGKSLEQFSVTEKIVFQGRYKKALAEPSRTAQEVDLSILYKIIDQCSLVHIDITFFYYLFEALYSDRVFHSIPIFCFLSAKLHHYFQMAKQNAFIQVDFFNFSV